MIKLFFCLTDKSLLYHSQYRHISLFMNSITTIENQGNLLCFDLSPTQQIYVGRSCLAWQLLIYCAPVREPGGVSLRLSADVYSANVADSMGYDD